MTRHERIAVATAWQAVHAIALAYWVRNSTLQGRWHVRAPRPDPPRPPTGEVVLFPAGTSSSTRYAA